MIYDQRRQCVKINRDLFLLTEPDKHDIFHSETEMKYDTVIFIPFHFTSPPPENSIAGVRRTTKHRYLSVLPSQQSVSRAIRTRAEKTNPPRKGRNNKSYLVNIVQF